MRAILKRFWRRVLNGVSYIRYLWVRYTHPPILIEIDTITPWMKANQALRARDITVLDYVWLLRIPSRENRKPGAPFEASKSEIKRWAEGNKIWMNGRPCKWDEKVEWPVERLVLFPGGKTQTSII